MKVLSVVKNTKTNKTVCSARRIAKSDSFIEIRHRVTKNFF